MPIDLSHRRLSLLRGLYSFSLPLGPLTFGPTNCQSFRGWGASSGGIDSGANRNGGHSWVALFSVRTGVKGSIAFDSH